MEEALLYVDLKTSRKKVVLCPFPFPNFPLPWFTCVTRYRMYWTRRLSPDLRCSSIHWVRVPGTSTVPAPPLLAVLAARPWPRATVRFAVRCTSCATPAAIFFSVPLTRQVVSLFEFCDLNEDQFAGTARTCVRVHVQYMYMYMYTYTHTAHSRELYSCRNSVLYAPVSWGHGVRGKRVTKKGERHRLSSATASPTSNAQNQKV